jgi:predicted ATP-grasp superfamily ATP-dependent carboligase
MKILVLDGNENQAVACVRSLARAGHSVVVGSTASWSKAGWSRSASGSFTYPAPQSDLEGFVARISEEVRKSDGTLVLPMTERTTLPLSIHRELISAAGGRLTLPSHEILERAFNKEATTELAASLGITVPLTRVLTSDSNPEPVAAALEYPVVLKPRSSEEFTAGQMAATGAPLYARNKAEFLSAFANLVKRCSAILIQEFIEGTGVGYFALLRDGELRAEFAHRRIRDVRPTGSGSSVRVSTEPDPRMREAALAILKALKWNGVAMVEFRMRADNTPVFLEVNGRFWNSLPLAVYAQADFPAMLASMAQHGDVPASLDYKLGLRCRWLLGDFRYLVEVWRGAPPGYPGTMPGRWRSLWEFVRPVPGTYHDNFRWDDPLPELGDWLDFAMRRLPRAFKKTNDARPLHVQRNYSRS